MKKLRCLLLFGLISLTVGCASISTTQSGDTEFRFRPDYEQRHHFFLWGLIGEHHINVKAICEEQLVKQMQTLFTWQDVLYSSLTVGLYLPRSARVWCMREEPSL